MWSPRGNELLYRNDNSLMAVPVSTSPTFAPGEPKALFSLPASPARYAMWSGGSRFLLTRAASGFLNEHIAVIENWTELMKPKK